MLTDEQIEAKATVIAEAVQGLKPAEWQRIERAIEKLYSSKSAKIQLDDSEEIKKSIMFGLKYD